MVRVVHTFNPSTQADLWIPSQPGLQVNYGKFQVNYGYRVKTLWGMESGGREEVNKEI